MEALPDLATLSDEQLRELIRELVDEEHRLSYQRRLLHGKIDILRAELVARLQGHVGESRESPLADVDVSTLTQILASKAPPPDEELAGPGDR